ncbi:anaerobic ribonucleoside-triphosphate reductase activating protein [uncultured Clostridium sp.]|uniref:anaerobic ribonucleoside-triphosphate reductase activating protein n=1 Tax=uncultured Clostridium sp. TaxID=59620 RepID=UPI0025F8AA3A|nr:anaerobic ribonucleoside-triphosphate reductase activating protein [uncultured Clostridium sp.]
MGNYAKINWFDVANGEGIRTSLFVSGCTHRCKGCFNFEAWDFNYGEKLDEDIIDDIISHITRKDRNIKGLSLLGGEPLENEKSILPLAKKLKEVAPEKSVWLWTGFTWDSIKHMEVLKYVDVLIDGKFQEENKNLKLKWRGSENQRVILVQESLKSNKIIEMPGV